LVFSNASIDDGTRQFRLPRDQVEDCTSTTVLSSSESCNVRVVFAPTSQHFVTGTVTLGDNSIIGNASQTIQLSGGPVLTSFVFSISPVTPDSPTFTVTALDQIGSPFDYSGSLTVNYRANIYAPQSNLSVSLSHGVGTFSVLSPSGTYVVSASLNQAYGSASFSDRPHLNSVRR
jgi:hypothetical protein